MKTLNKAVARYNGISLIVRILVGLIIGAVLALVAPGAGWVGELGSLFVGALKGIAPVLVFVIVASALAQGSSKLDRRFGTVIWLYMLTTFLAAAIAVVTSFMFPVTVVLADAAQSDVVPQGLGEVMGTLLTNFVANPVSAIMSGNYIGILFWACMFGVAMKKIGSDTTKTFMANTADAVSQIVRWIINLAPSASWVWSTPMFPATALPSLPSTASCWLCWWAPCCSWPHRLPLHHVYLSGLQPLSAGVPLLRESGLTAFFTRSSAANIPVNMALCEKLGLDKDMYSVSIPLGATINMDGAAITITIMTLAAANTLHSGVSACSHRTERYERSGCLRRFRRGRRFPAADPHGLLPVRHLQRCRHADGGCRLHHRRGAGLCGDCLNSAGDVEFAATAEYHQWRKQGKPLPEFLLVRRTEKFKNIEKGCCQTPSDIAYAMPPPSMREAS